MSNIFKYFKYLHLPEKAQTVAKEFYHMAEWVDVNIPKGREKDKCLKKLCEAKDCAVNVFLPKKEEDKRCYFAPAGNKTPFDDCVCELTTGFNQDKCNHHHKKEIKIFSKDECEFWR